MADEIKFPVTFDKCPHCGSSRRVAEMFVEQLKAEGRMAEKANAAIRVLPVVIAQPGKIMVTAPALVVSYDICTDCGTEYCVRVDLATATPQYPQPPGMKGFGFPSGDPRLS